jgi:hypothetical protein
MPRNVIFAGPTCGPPLHAALAAQRDLELRPPAGRGDIRQLLKEEPGTIVLVDGKFHQSLAVGHAEIRAAIAGGWRVWGLGSMGAIRAREMRDFGMLGFGRVFAHYLADGDFQDDEVALIHAPEPPYDSVSEPLVHIRYCLWDMRQAGLLDEESGFAIVCALKRLWFGQRSLARLTEFVDNVRDPRASAAIRTRLRDFHIFRAKTIDLELFIARRMWEEGSYVEDPLPAPFGVIEEVHA